jgi:hypothetical protein
MAGMALSTGEWAWRMSGRSSAASCSMRACTARIWRSSAMPLLAGVGTAVRWKRKPSISSTMAFVSPCLGEVRWKVSQPSARCSRRIAAVRKV